MLVTYFSSEVEVPGVHGQIPWKVFLFLEQDFSMYLPCFVRSVKDFAWVSFVWNRIPRGICEKLQMSISDFLLEDFKTSGRGTLVESLP